MRTLYGRVLLPALLPIALLVALGHAKLRHSLLARIGVGRRLRAAAARRDPTRPLIWFHVASAGELLQAEPVLHRCRAAGAQVAVTLTSVSGLGWATRLARWPELVWADVLPLEFPGALERLWGALRPDALVFVQADLWPGLIWEAERRGTPILLFAARLGRRAFRLVNPLARAFYRSLYGRVWEILAASEADCARLGRLVPGHPALTLGGDPGIETALARVDEAPLAALPAGFDRERAPVLIVGSSWPADEARWLPVARRALERHPALRLVVAPHEPAESRLRALEAALAGSGTIRLSALEADGPAAADGSRVVLVDSVGRLAGLYRAGSLAYVGGGFSTGVHNVAEPAAAGLPVLFGPRYGNSAVAEALLVEGVAFAVGDEATLERALEPLLADRGRAAVLGATARGVVARLGGAAQLCYERIAAAVPALGGGPHP